MSRRTIPASSRTMLLAFFAGSLTLAAASTAAEPISPRAGGQPTIGAVEFEPKPFRIESMGLTISLPKGAEATSTSIGNQAALELLGPDKRWVAAARVLQSGDQSLTVEQVAEANLRSQLGQDTFTVGEVAKSGSVLLERTSNLILNGNKADRIYILGPGKDAADRLVYALTFIQVGPGRFATFEATFPEASLERVKPELEATIASATFANSGLIEASQLALLEAGAKFLETIDEATLRRVVSEQPEVWWRLYVPAKTGADTDAREVGYRRIKAWIGQRGQIDPARKPESFQGADRDEGVLIQIDFRGLLGDNNEILTDSQGVFFLSLDRSEESWTLSTRVRQGTSDTTNVEIGHRLGNRLTVRKGPGQPRTLVLPERGYLSRVEALLLNRLLVQSRLTADFAFQSYSSESELIDIRRDSVEELKDRPGIFRITTRVGEGGTPQVATIKADGTLLFATLAGSTRVEPTRLDQLARLWKSKGLPLD